MLVLALARWPYGHMVLISPSIEGGGIEVRTVNSISLRVGKIIPIRQQVN